MSTESREDAKDPDRDSEQGAPGPHDDASGAPPEAGQAAEPGLAEPGLAEPGPAEPGLAEPGPATAAEAGPTEEAGGQGETGPGTPSAAATAPAAAPARPRGGRILGGLALLVALAALGGAGYLYYHLIYLDDTPDLTGRLDGLAAELGDTDARFAALERDRQQALDELRDQQARARAETAAALRAALAEVSRQAPPSTGEWQRAEIQYLLRIANHRLLMERDVTGALTLLQAADGVLQQLDDFSLHEVRARLADEIAALEGIEGVDLEGVFLRLEAAKRDLDTLPLKVPEYIAAQAPQAAETPEASGPLAALESQLDRYLRFRRFEGAVKPLLAPEEAVYLALNLRLMLERAQMAALRGEQLMFEESINTALDWIDEYLDTSERPAERLISELQALTEVELEQALPDISGSLNALQDVLRNPA